MAGTILLSVVVDASGNIRVLQVTRSLGHGLDEEAIKAANQWKFAPATRNGIPVAVKMGMRIKFQLY